MTIQSFTTPDFLDDIPEDARARLIQLTSLGRDLTAEEQAELEAIEDAYPMERPAE